MARQIQRSTARPSSESSEMVGSDELPPSNPVLPLIIDASDDCTSEHETYVGSSDEHYVKKRDLGQAIIAPVSIVSVVKHENVAVDDDSFEAAESSHIFRPVFRQRSVVEERVRRRKAVNAPAPVPGRKVRN